MKLKYIAVIAAIFPLFVSVHADAQQREDDRVTVTFHDVDFNSARDVHRVFDRLMASAKAVCDSEGAVDPMTAMADRDCEVQAVADAVRDLNQPRLRDYAARKLNLNFDTLLADAGR